MKNPRSPEQGIGTIEILVVFSLFAITLMGIVGLHTIAISTGTAAETSSIATNLARARLEELLSLPPARIIEQAGTQVARVPPGQGRAYTIQTAVDTSNPARLDIAVTVSSEVVFGPACAGGPTGACAGHPVTVKRTLETRIRRP